MRTLAIEAIVDTLIKDLTQRKGLSQAWEEIDECIQKEIKLEWFRLIAEKEFQ